MRTTKEHVIKAASDLADRNGLSGVSLKAVAEALGIRTPSLYNHIESLEALLLEVANGGMEEMNRLMAQAAVGISGDAAIKAAGGAYLRFMIAHPGVYETIQWAGWHQNAETARHLSDYHELLTKLVLSCGLSTSDPEEAVRVVEGFLHGYTTQLLGRALKAPDAALSELSSALEIVLLGLHQKYK